MFIKHLVECAGLSENEAKVYLATLGLGKVLASTIARKAGINRASIYSITSALAQKGLMGMTVINNITYFYASDPSALLSAKSIEMKNQQLKLKNLCLIMPELQMLRSKAEENQAHCYMYIGSDATAKLYEKIVTVKNSVLHSISQSKSYINEGLMPRKDFDVNRIANNILHKVILMTNEDLKNGQLNGELLDKRHILIPNGYFSDSIIHLHDNKMIFICSKPQSEAIVFENKSCFDFMMDIFNYLWNSAK